MQVLIQANLDVALVDTTSFKSFDVRLAPGADPARMVQALEGIAEVEGGDHAWVLESWVLDQLAKQPPVPDWRASFNAMTDYARKKGWMRDGPSAIRAHIVSGGSGSTATRGAPSQ